ncbi:peroxide/acid stress response protein YhcN [Atlantibacter sp.]|uniref:peroxide/acid stress response protein YhcN n=1 Tax=Atlantibacter sp. TaxID=1903473 RepID=UPI0028A6A4C9|nr:peroxide/acid stress response protein YhcN [Atlantibacter sp.]
MKTKFTLAAVTLASLMAFGANAAVEQVSAQDAQNMQSMGTISVAQHGSSPMDMREALAEKADQKGATAYRVIEARTGDTWHATAELYK